MAQIAFTVKTGVEKGTATFSVDSTESYVNSGGGDSDLFDIGCEGKSITVNGVDPVIGTVTLANSTVYVDKSKVYSDDPGETEITGGTVQATAYKKNHSTEAFTSGDVAWSVSPTGKGVTINESTGVITVASTATAQNFTITAGAVNDKSSADTSPSTATLTVAYTNPTPTSIVVSGGVTAMSVEENESVAETAFSAVVKDQWGEDMDDESVTWSISPTGQGVTIDANGKVHVAPTATVDGTTGKDFTVTATSVTKDSVTANAGSHVHISSLAPWTFTGSYATGNAGTTITYGEAAPTLTTSVSDSGTPTYSYSSSDTDVATIDSNGAITIVGAGTATLTVTAAYSAGEHAATQGTHVLTVSKKALTVTAKNHSIVYGDAPANDGVTITGFVNDESQSDLGGTLAFAYTYEQYGDVGESYKITPSGLTSDNYEITFHQGTLTVAQKEVGLTWTDDSFTYDGNEHAPTATAGNLVNGDTITVTVTGGQTNAGDNYTATASELTGTKASNYKLPTENTKAFTIAPMNITPVVVLSAESGNYTGISQKPNVTVYTDNNKATELTLNTDYTLAWTPNDSVTDVGTYTVTATGMNSGSNYKFTTATATFTMDKAAQTTAVTITGAADKTYGDTDFTVTVGGGDSTGAYTLTAAPTGYVTVTAGNTDGEFTLKILKASGSGDITLTASRAGDNNYAAATEVHATFKIAKATPTESNFDITTPTAVTYDGTAKSVTAPTVKSGVTGMGAVTVKYNGSETAPTDAGNHTVTFDVAEGDNYNAATGLSIGTLTIAPKTVQPTISGVPTSMEYTGSQLKPAVTVKDGTTTIPAIEYTVSYENNTDAGEATITVTDKADGNYTWTTPATATFTITPATYTGTLTITGGTAAGIKASDELTAALAPTPGSGDTVTYQWTKNGTDIEGATNATYTLPSDVETDSSFAVKATITGNHTATLTSAAVVVGKKTLDSITLGVTGTKTVGETLTATVTGSIDEANYDIEWYRDGTTKLGTGTTYKIVAADQGHSITAKLIAKGDYTGEVTSDAQAIPAGTPTLTVTATAGNAQATVNWSVEANGATITQFTVECKDGSTVIETVTVDASTKSHTFTGLTNGTEYTFVVTTVGSTPTGTGNAKVTPKAPVTPSNPTTPTTPTPSSTDSTSGGGGGGGYTPRDRDTDSSNTTNKNTTTNADGSTTTTVKNSDGSVTETTRATDGSTTTTKTEKTGEATTTEKTADGSTGTTKTDAAGNTVAASATVSQQAVRNAARYGSAVKVPVSVKASNSAASAAAVEIALPETSEPVAVEIPVENVSAGTVAVIVHPDGTEEIVKTSTVGKDGVVLTLDGSAKVKIVDNSKYFADVPSYEWYSDNVAWASSREIMNGTGDFAFAPNDPTSRSMVAQLLFNLDGAAAPNEITTLFADVNPSDWYANSVTWAINSGVARGMGDNLFGANQVVTREQFAVMMYNYAKLKGYDVSTSGSLASFPDAGSVSDWAADAMAWAVGVGLINGTTDANGSTVLNAQGTATRAQVAAIMQRFCEKVAK